MDTMKKTFIASVDSISQSDLYLTVKARLFTAPSANLNGCRCTEAFLDEIVQHQEKYITLPLSADVRNLCNGHYEKLGHMYNSTTGEFHSTAIGSYYKFEKQELDDGQFALVGYARIWKRYKKVCQAICELFADGNLNFSFEVTCGKYEKLDDGTILIDADESNMWEGQAVVWSPACPDAVALELVAELQNIDQEEGDENAMQNENVIVAEEAVKSYNEANAVFEDSTDAAEVVASTVEVEEHEEANVEVGETVDVEDATTETAAYVCEVHKTIDDTHVCQDDGTCVDTHDESTVAVSYIVDEKENTVNASDEVVDASCNTTEEKNAEAEEVVEECKCEEPVQENAEADTQDNEVVEDASCEKKNASVDYAEVIAQLTASIEALKTEIASLKEERKETVVAEINNESDSVNPFMASISSPKKWSLLQKEESSNSGSLYDKY